MARLTRALASLAAALMVRSAAAQESYDLQFKEAGVCARCHVISVVEWGMSRHRRAGNTCTGCHGESKGHVVDERNNIKPERIPRGEAIVPLCSSCHRQGCPKSGDKAGCPTCHQVHALINPDAPPAKDERLERLVAQSEPYPRKMAEGERLVKLGQWEKAAAEFRAALESVPSDRKAESRLKMCERRLHPALAGFEDTGGQIDPETGLPREARVSGTDIVMVLVPGGEADIGSEKFPAATPVHTIAVEAFYLGKFEITQAQWKAVTGSNPSAHQGKDYPAADRMPVEQVSWEDAQEFIRKLNQLVPGGGFRLPAEAEWEYAARTGETGESLAVVAWFDAPADAFAPKPVGSKAPNKLGLFDMQGNVSEWCSDPYSSYPGGRDANAAADSDLRVLRGGGYADSDEFMDPGARHASRADRRLRWNGLRIARTPEELTVRIERRTNWNGSVAKTPRK